MVVWSSLQKLGTTSFRGAFTKLFKNEPIIIRSFKTNSIQMSGHGPEKFAITPSNWQWSKFKDYVHFYVMVGAIPIFTIIFITNVFIGPATLTEIPEGYTPHHWEYHKHPITRFISKYFHPSPQETYEKKLDWIFEDDEQRKIKRVTRKIDALMAERNDYQLYYYKPISVKNFRIREEEAHDLRDKYVGVK